MKMEPVIIQKKYKVVNFVKCNFFVCPYIWAIHYSRWTKIRVGQKKIPYFRKGLSVFKEKGVTPLLVRTFDLPLIFQGYYQGRVLSV